MIYLAGPMSGFKDHNHPQFDEAAKLLEADGHVVVNPANNFGGRQDLTRAQYMRLDISLLLQCDTLAVLPGAMLSKGASLELSIAEQLDMTRIYLYDTPDGLRVGATHTSVPSA